MPTAREAAAVFGSDAVAVRGDFAGLEWQGHFIIFTGMGKANTAAVTASYLAQSCKNFTPVLAGIAGAYPGGPLKVGDICQVRFDYFADEAEYGAEGLSDSVLPDANFIECLTPFNDIPVYDANTVSLLPGTDEMAQMYHSKTGAWLESMEGAAFALACQKAGMPAVQIRAVSNYCGSKENHRWNAKLAARSLQAFLKKLLPPV